MIRKPYQTIELVSETQAKCSICSEVKDLTQFRSNKGQWAGRKFSLSFCNKCRTVRVNTRLAENQLSFFKAKIGQIKARAKARGHEFNLTAEFLLRLWDIQDGRCFYSDVPMLARHGEGKKPSAVSVDRVDISRGYVEDNVVLCTDRMNTIKNDLTLEEVEYWIPKIYARLREAGYIRLY